MTQDYDHTTSDFEASTAGKRRNLRKEAQLTEQENNEKLIQTLNIDKHAVTTVDDIVEATDDHEDEIMDAFDAWKKESGASNNPKSDRIPQSD